MIVNLLYPNFERIKRHCMFCIVTSLTTWNNVVKNISNFIIHSIYPIMNISSPVVISLVCLIRMLSTIKTRLTGYFSDLSLTQLPNVSTPNSIFLGFCIKGIKCGLSKGHTFSTRFALSASKTSSSYNLILSTITSTKPHYNVRLFSVFLDRDICIFSGNNQKISISVSSFIYKICSWHSITLKGAPRMEIGTDVQAVRPIGERVKRKIRLRNCLNNYSISQMVFI